VRIGAQGTAQASKLVWPSSVGPQACQGDPLPRAALAHLMMEGVGRLALAGVGRVAFLRVAFAERPAR